jgi:hypothetical protein
MTMVVVVVVVVVVVMVMMMMMMMAMAMAMAMTAVVGVIIIVSVVPQRDEHVCNVCHAESILDSPESSRVLLGDCPVLPHFSYPGMCSVICKIQNGTVQRHFVCEEGHYVHSAENKRVLLITFVSAVVCYDCWHEVNKIDASLGTCLLS